MKKLYKFNTWARKQNKQSEHYEPHRESGVFGIHIGEDNVLTIVPVKGVSVPLVTFFEIVEQDKEVSELLVNSNHNFKRKNHYKILRHEGISGCVDYYIEWIDGYIADLFPVTKRKHLFHTSMYGKINEIIRIFLPDFYLLLNDLARDAANDLSEDFDVEFYEVPLATLGDYIDPSLSPAIENFVPDMGWQSKAGYLAAGIKAGIDEYMRHPQYLSKIYVEYILYSSEYQTLKKVFTEGKIRHKDYDLYENEADTVFIHVCHNEKVTSIVLNSVEVAV